MLSWISRSCLMPSEKVILQFCPCEHCLAGSNLETSNVLRTVKVREYFSGESTFPTKQGIYSTLAHARILMLHTSGPTVKVKGVVPGMYTAGLKATQCMLSNSTLVRLWYRIKYSSLLFCKGYLYFLLNVFHQFKGVVLLASQ